MQAASREAWPARFSGAALQDQGAALVFALLAMTLALALGAAMLVLTDIEVLGASHQRDGMQTFYAADAGLESTIDELRHLPDWTGALSGLAGSRVTDSTTLPMTVLAGPLDLLAQTMRLQADTDARNSWGANGPQWRLFAYGHLAAFAPVVSPRPGAYLVVWLADDEAEMDSNPFADSNDSVRVRSEAFGPRGSRRVVEAVIVRTARPGVVRLAAWRESR